MKRILSLVLSMGMAVSAGTMHAAAEEASAEGLFVLMNIPYSEFYEGEGFPGIDAVAGATIKTYNLTLAAGSYHEGYDAAEDVSEARILGVSYPVYVEDPSVLSGFTEVKDEDRAEIDIAQGRSGIAKTEVSGKDLLFASGDYAYYVLKEEPSNYKILTAEDEDISFSAVKHSAEKADGLQVSAVYTDHHVDVVLQLTDAVNLTDDITVTGVIVTDENGTEYVLQHITGFWRQTQIGWSWTGMDGNGLAGKKVTKVTFYLNRGNDYKVLSYDTDIEIKLQPSAITAEFTASDEIVVSGLPADITDASAKVETVVGRGETSVVLAENAAIENGIIHLSSSAASETEYRITVSSGNYAESIATAFSPKAYTGFKDEEGNETSLKIVEGKLFWFENGEKQGAYGDPQNIFDTAYGKLERGREIYDPNTDAWYWLDADNEGAVAVDKEVWLPYVYQGVEDPEGKWVRYDRYGAMIKGWYANENGVYYYDLITGAMLKGGQNINGKTYVFDDLTGILK